MVAALAIGAGFLIALIAIMVQSKIEQGDWFGWFKDW